MNPLPRIVPAASLIAAGGLAMGLLAASFLPAQEPSETPAPASGPDASSGSKQEPPAKPSRKLVSLNPQKTVLLDREKKHLVIESKVVLRKGMLEMLLCKAHTKEHESILAFEGDAKIIHAGLLSLGLEPGDPVVFLPKFQAPSGPTLEIELVWKDKQGKQQRASAKRWIRHSIHRYFGAPLAELPDNLDLPKNDPLRYDDTNDEFSWYGPMSAKQRDEYLALSDDPAYQKAIKSFHKRTRNRPLEATFVFTGSEFVRDQRTGREIYLAESGDVICVANFPSALIDIAAKSSAEGQQSLLYEAWTERIPPKGTPVRILITPVKKKPAKEK